MNNRTLRGFFAYPSMPLRIPEIINTAIERINAGHIIQIKPWETSTVTGKIIIDEICKDIDKSELFCADLTQLNPNVLFELGYAIARKKRIWLILDSSFYKTRSMFDQMKMLTTVGYANYSNSNDIVTAFYKDKPLDDISTTIFKQSIEPSLLPEDEESFLFLKGRHNTEASNKMSQELDKYKFRIITDDPRESSAQTITWYGVNVYKSFGVLCLLSDPEREGALLINARYALVAGMAYGFNKPILMMTEGDYLSPIDYRDKLHHYQTAGDALYYFTDWLTPLYKSWKKRESDKDKYTESLKLSTELRGLQLGQYVAENETDKLIEEYFVETAAYLDALAGNSTIFVGKKGTGKTANLYRLKNELEKEKDSIVVIIKPVTYDLAGVIRLLKQYKERDTKGYAIESLWKYLIYSEIAFTIIELIQRRNRSTWSIEEIEFEDIIIRQLNIVSEDFSVRIERAARDLVELDEKRKKESNIAKYHVAISETLHRGNLKILRDALSKILQDKKRLTILIDNLDKTWDRQSDILALAEVLLGLLSAATRLGNEIKKNIQSINILDVGLVIFLRSDIFHKVRSVSREPDKLKYSKISWDDPELLLRVIDQRLICGRDSNVSPIDIWNKYFCSHVRGIPIREYIVTHILNRPRDLLFFVINAIATAVNRGHEHVEEQDIKDAEKYYSQYALETILVENTISVEQLEDVLYEFAGCNSILNETEVRENILQAGIEVEKVDEVKEHLYLLAFLGVEVRDEEFRFVNEPDELKKYKRLSRNLVTNRIKIHEAFWAYLEIEHSN